MSGNGNWDNLGEQINKIVQDTLNQENIKQFNDKVIKTASSTLAEVREQVLRVSDEYRNTGQSFKENKKSEHEKNHVAKMKQVGGVAGVLYMVFGGIGLGVMSLLMLLILMLHSLGFFYVSAGTMLTVCVLAVGSFLMINSGAKKRRRLERAARYLKLCGSREYVNIKELVQKTGKSSRYLIKDINKMIQLGIYPEGHLDHQNSCLMLNQNIYNQYLKLEDERRAREINGQVAQVSEQPDINENQTELETMASEGKEYIRRLQELNNDIEGEVISTKLFYMENLLTDLFHRVEANPDQIPKIQRLMEYYLPMTIKLVTAYSDFDRISAPDQDILSAKAEIEKTLDTINHAFGEILNSLYRDVALDVTTDAQVLQSMMAREGLTNEL